MVLATTTVEPQRNSPPCAGPFCWLKPASAAAGSSGRPSVFFAGPGFGIMAPTVTSALMERSRTTIYLRSEHRVRLAEAAAKRGRKDISSIIAEALDAYFQVGAEDEATVKRLLALKGTLTPTEARAMRANAKRAR